MAAWKRKGGLEPFHERLVGRHGREGLRRASSPSASSSRSRASANTAFRRATPPASRCWSTSAAGSSATTPTPSSPRCSTAQPMGFYAPAQLVRDAREHGVAVRPVDVTVSDWDSTLEGDCARGRARAAPRAAAGAARPGRVNGPRRRGRPSASSPRAPRRRSPASKTWRGAPRLDAHALAVLAAADALQALTGHRHQAVWAVAGIDTRPTELLRATRTRRGRASRSPRRARARRCSPTTARWA